MAALCVPTRASGYARRGVDEIASLRTARAISSRLGNAPLVVLEGVDHVPMKQAPQRFSEIALAWFAGGALPANRPEPTSESRELDLAGTTLEGSEASLHAKQGSTRLFCSVCRLESPQQRTSFHDTLDLLEGARF